MRGLKFRLLHKTRDLGGEFSLKAMCCQFFSPYFLQRKISRLFLLLPAQFRETSAPGVPRQPCNDKPTCAAQEPASVSQEMWG